MRQVCRDQDYVPGNISRSEVPDQKLIRSGYVLKAVKQ